MSVPPFLFLEMEPGVFSLTLNSSKLTTNFYSQVWSFCFSVGRFFCLIEENSTRRDCGVTGFDFICF